LILFCFLLAVEYDIEVQTGNEQIEPLDSPVYIQIYGTTGTTPKLFLEPKNSSFSKDSISKFHISNNDVGEVKKIKFYLLNFISFSSDSKNCHRT
jgi:hypothetical protein